MLSQLSRNRFLSPTASLTGLNQSARHWRLRGYYMGGKGVLMAALQDDSRP